MNPAVFDIIFVSLGIDLYAPNTQTTLICAAVAMTACVALRVFAGIIYYSNISALVLFAKPVERKSEVKRTPSSLINRCVAEYMVCGENGAPLSAVDAIVMKNLVRMNILGISLGSLEKLCVWLEVSVLGIAAASAVMSGEAGWLVLIGGVYLACKVILLYFDAETLKNKLYYGITTYLNRELGKFYIPDDKAGLRVFKSELHSTLMEQASILQNSINNLSAELSGNVRESFEMTRKTLDNEMKKYDDLGDRLAGQLDGLGGLFARFDRAAGLFQSCAETLSRNIALMNEKLGVLSGELGKNSASGAASLENTRLAYNELRDGLKSFGLAYSAIEAELSSVAETQKALELSLQSYELSLQQTAGQVGDAIGSIVEYKGKEASEALNESIAAYVKQFRNDTTVLLDKMTALFEQSYEQNKSIAQTLFRIEESVK